MVKKGHHQSQASHLTRVLRRRDTPGRRWTPELNGPVVSEAVALFGAARCMVASNFPVDGLLATYDEVMGGFRALIAPLPEAEQRRVLHGTAAETYRIAL